jgi:hypothetical protein
MLDAKLSGNLTLPINKQGIRSVLNRVQQALQWLFGRSFAMSSILRAARSVVRNMEKFVRTIIGYHVDCIFGVSRPNL